VAALAQGHGFAVALRRASAAASLACTRMGAQAGVPQAVEVEELLANGRESSSPDELRRLCGLA
jgi:ribokinase